MLKTKLNHFRITDPDTFLLESIYGGRIWERSFIAGLSWIGVLALVQNHFTNSDHAPLLHDEHSRMWSEILRFTVT